MAKAVSDGRGRPKKLFDRNIAKDRKVSKFHLDRAAEEQPDAFGYWSDLKPKARKKVENLTLDLDIATGKKFAHYKDVLDGGVDSKGIKKLPTDTMVNSAIISDDEIIKIKRDIIENQEYLGLIESAIKTMDQRRSSIKVLESLNNDNYFESQGKSADDYNARESKKDKIKEGKNKIGEGLSKLNIPEEEEIVETEDVPEEDIVEETEDRGAPDEDDLVEEELTEQDSDVPEEEETEDISEKDEPEGDGTPDEEEETEVVESEEDDSTKCPYGFKLGVDFGMKDQCDECDMEGVCFRESKKL